ncbi:phosphatidylserine decarboxylase [Priestia koreensis]|uniref:phosphatidylserine decarboxylase n=1 Tax=Priestia koreensis TaxID=284581 RepID=A0A0M0KZK9_9BACI|nr:phosphatidylserine decarboxylase [Priestia koreensis]KOO43843.1 phosphatidylserine decarboxylase [Priestia koreensis]
MRKNLYRFMIELTNHPLSSSMIKRFSLSSISSHFISSYARVYKINQNEMKNELNTYKTLQEFFIRELKDTARPIDADLTSIVSPVDAVIESMGTVTPEKEITVKNKQYSIEEMIGDDEILQKYVGGEYIILYLSPKDYHRIHSPIQATIDKQWTLGGKSYPVNSWGLKYGKDPITKNYRKLLQMKGSTGDLLLVKVGAMFINSIETTVKNEHVKKGEEVGYFSFGSTVVLFLEKGKLHLSDHLQPQQPVRVGERIGTI